jgi:hypothetical protein
MRRLVGIPVALFVIVAVPTLVGQQPAEQTAANKAQPAPAEAKLTVRLEGGEGAGTKPTHVAVLVAGPQPAAATTLVDASGERRGTVISSPGACNQINGRSTGVGQDRWCLGLSDVAKGAELSGTVGGTGTKLTLTVTRRDPFCPWPLVVLLAGIGIAAVAALAPKGLKRFIRRVALARLLEQNREASANETIAGLDGWVAAQLAAGTDPSKVFSTIAPVVKNGPNQARTARQQLQTALSEDPLGAGNPFATGARQEAERTDHRVGDFLEESGKTRAQHPASKWRDGVLKMSANRDELEQAERDINKLIKPECRATALQALSLARVTYGRIMKPDQLTEVDAPLDALHKAINETLAKEDCRAETEDVELSQENIEMGWQNFRFRGVLRRGLPEPSEQLELGSAGLGASLIAAIVLTAIFCLLVITFAAVTVEEAVYRDNHTFAGWHDYFKLLSAALASGAAATVLGFLAYWRPDPPAAST